jgi:hypothetical protein
MYFTEVGPASGTLLYRDACSPVAIVRGRDEPTVIGRAKCVGWMGGGEALWWLRIDRADMPGLWVVIDREFRPAW